MAGFRFDLTLWSAIDINGRPLNGAKLYFYVSGTSTLLNTYLDSSLTIPNANPVVADSNGRWSDIFLLPKTYKVVLTSSNDVVIDTIDPVFGINPGVTGAMSAVDVVDSMAELPRSTLMDGLQIQILGRHNIGDGGGGTFYWDATSTATPNGGTIFAIDDQPGRWIRNYSGQVNVKWFGAKGNGTDYDRSAIQSAIAFGQEAGSDILYPSGEYLIDGALSSDDMLNGLVIPFTSPNDYGKRVRLIFERGAKLLAGANNMIVLRMADSYSVIDNPVIDGNGYSGVYGIAIGPEDMDQTNTLVWQMYNAINNPAITRCAEGIVMQCGPDVAGSDSGCWYNNVWGGHVYSCTRGVWFKDGPNASSSGVNRNSLIRTRIGQNCNTGIQIDSGDGNESFGVQFEGINSGTAPNAIPTAVKIKASGLYSGDNNSNKIIASTFEACTRHVDNANAYSEFYGCDILDSACVWGALPLVKIGGHPSAAAQILPGACYQAGSQIAGVLNNALQASGPIGYAARNYEVLDANGALDKSGRIRCEVVGNITNGGTKDAVLVPAARLSAVSVNIVAGMIQALGVTASQSPTFAEYRFVARIAPGLSLGQWGVVEVYNDESQGVDDWRVSTAGLIIQSISIEDGALVATMQAATAALNNVQLRIDLQHAIL